MTAFRQSAPSPKEKVTISVDASLLSLVDSFVHKTKGDGTSRSSVVEHALRLWKQEVRESFDDQYYAENKDALTDPDWSAITTAAAKKIWERKEV